MIYFITVNYYSTHLIAHLIQSIGAIQGASYQVVIVNNSPDDASIYHLKSERITVLEAGNNLGFGQGCNLGLNWVYAQNPEAIVWIINPDTYLIDNAFNQAQNFWGVHPYLSIVGTIVYKATGEVWFTGGRFVPERGEITAEIHLEEASEKDYIATEWVSGCSLLINLKRFQVCPQFDPEYFLYYEDFDFCRRYAKQGHSIVITHQIKVGHQASAIANRNLRLKFKHSTYAYLLTLERYTSERVLRVRLIRLILHAFLLIPFKPSVAFGKLDGLWMYGRRSLKRC